MDSTHIKQQLQSRKFRRFVIAIGIAVATLLVFSAGMEVGFMKASFNYRFGEKYYGTFGPRPIHAGVGFIPNDISDSHGVSGRIVSITMPRFVVADKDNTEKIVRLGDDTVIRRLRDSITGASLEVGEDVIVIGTPNEDSEIEAKFIRIVPPMPVTTTIPIPPTGMPQGTQK